MAPDEIFAALVEHLAGEPGVTTPAQGSTRRFGSRTLQVDGSIFAMVVQDRLVLKLPRSRVEHLVEDGTGAPFENGKGRPMKEWLTVTTGDLPTCLALAGEALTFVGRRSP